LSPCVVAPRAGRGGTAFHACPARRSSDLRCSRAEASAPGGCEPLDGWASCWGSPKSTILSAATETARVLASENCPASSTTRTSTDRKSTRLNSSHVKISYAVFCLKKKKKD